MFPQSHLCLMGHCGSQLIPHWVPMLPCCVKQREYLFPASPGSKMEAQLVNKGQFKIMDLCDCWSDQMCLAFQKVVCSGSGQFEATGWSWVLSVCLTPEHTHAWPRTVRGKHRRTIPSQCKVITLLFTCQRQNPEGPLMLHLCGSQYPPPF